MRIVLDLDDDEIRDSISQANDDKRQSGDVDKITIKDVRAQMHDDRWLKVLATFVISQTIEDLW